jgi:hypothetical protein
VGPDVPRATFIQFDNISSQFNGSQTIFTLAIGGAPYFPGSNENVLISLGGVLQIPGQSFVIVGDSIDFSPVPPATDTTFLGYSLSGVSGSGGIAGTGTVTQVSTGNGLIGGPISTSGTISLKVATTGALGGVIPDGTTITVSGAGLISVSSTIPKIVSPPPGSSASPGNLGEIAFGAGFFYWYDGTQWLQAAGSTF